MTLIQKLNWRYATKAMNGQNIPQEKLERILEAARLAPSSYGLQPYKIMVVSNPLLKEKIKAAAYNQRVLTECACLLVFAAWDTYTEARINKAFDRTRSTYGKNIEEYENKRKHLLSLYPQRSAEENFIHIARQCYISLGIAAVAAAEENIDATPMEGFENEKIDALLGLEKEQLKSTLLLTLGYRDPNQDWLAHLPKARTPKADFITYFS